MGLPFRWNTDLQMIPFSRSTRFVSRCCAVRRSRSSGSMSPNGKVRPSSFLVVPGSSLTAVVRYSDFEQRTSKHAVEISACTGIDVGAVGFTSTSVVRNPFTGWDTQVQQTTRVGRHQLIAGHHAFTQDKELRCRETIALPGVGSFDQVASSAGTDKAGVTYVRDEIALTDRIHASLGVAYQQMEFADVSTSGTTVRDEAGRPVRHTGSLSDVHDYMIAATESQLTTQITVAHPRRPFCIMSSKRNAPGTRITRNDGIRLRVLSRM